MEFSFITLTLFFVKLYSAETFLAVTFFTVCLPLMLYLVITLFGNLLKFIQMMHIEIDDKGNDSSMFGLLSKK